MRILHVLAYLSADGAYGGPASVALAQVRGLAGHHEVALVAGGDGTWSPAPDDRFQFVPVRSWRRGGSFGSLVSPAMWREVARRAKHADVVHVHLARDFAVAISARWIAGRRTALVVQAHGMLNSTGGRLLAAYDRFLVRPVLRRAGAVLTLTARDGAAITRIAPSARQLRIANGVAVPGRSGRRENPVPEVVFLARVHPRKRVQLFVQMAQVLRDAGVGCSCVVVGPDGGDLAAVEAEIASGAPVGYEGPIEPGAVLDRLRRADVLVLPSYDDQFPMVVLEALSVGTPVVVDETCGLAGRLRWSAGARVAGPDPVEYSAAVRDLLDDHEKASRAAVELAEREFSIEAVVDVLLEEYARAAERERAR